MIKSNDFTKKHRKDWLRKALDGFGLENYGRATQMSSELGCSMSTVQGWLRGSLPRDLELAHKVSVTYKIDLIEWITLEPSRKLIPQADDDLVLQAVLMTKEFEVKQGGEGFVSPLNPESFTKVFTILLGHLSGDTPTMSDTMNFMHAFIDNEKNEGQG